MAKPTGGLLAFDARGSLGKTIVYSTWRGRNYVRRYVVPGNPRSSDQTVTRTLFGWLQGFWKLQPAIFSDPWTAAAKGRPLTNRNLFTSQNMKSIGTDIDLTNFIFVGGANAGLPAGPIVAAATITMGELSISFSVPVGPSGWTLTSLQAFVVKDQDPQTDAIYDTSGNTGLTSPIVITGLDSGDLYQVALWPVWTKPDGSIAYGANSRTTGTPL